MTFLLPVAALVHRELVRSLRRVRPFVLLAGILTGPVLIVLAVWPGVYDNVRDTARLSRDMVNIISVYLVVMVGALLPGYASTAILQEREQGTFEMMSLTLIRPSGIVVGKVLNSVGFFFLIVAACAPVIASVFFLVGLDWASLLFAGVVLAAATLSCAAVGVLCSAWVRRVIPAAVLSYAVTFLLMGGPLYVLASMLEASWGGSLSSQILKLASVACPIQTMYEMAYLQAGSVLLAQALGYQACVLTICLALACIRLRRPYEPPHEAASRKKGPGGFAKWLLIGSPHRKPRSIADRTNPVFAQEMLWGPLTNRGARWRTFIALMLLSVGAMCPLLAMSPALWDVRLWGRPEFPTLAFVVLQCIVIGVLAPAISANAVTKEYERNNMDMLRMTPLGARRIVFGKWQAGIAALAPAFAAALASWFVLFPWIPSFAHRGALLAAGFATLVVAAMLSVSLGMLASTLARHTTMAVVRSYLLCALVYFGLPMTVAAGTQMFRGVFGAGIPYEVRRMLLDVACYLSPFVTYFKEAEPLFRRSPWSWFYAGNVLFHGVFSVVLVGAVAVLFRWLHMQDTQPREAVLALLRFRRRAAYDAASEGGRDAVLRGSRGGGPWSNR